ncbi:methionyl-tRNA formyltransferase [Microbacterium sp. C7(2022)]|uniref:methionyl-tRNA formyltransferase n=1 Tax=Microbacterium sp. C7(2022) TaxID=2992759 RepID=UPI00237B9586|nr:methionyl-tRNA formyltransferase [Microbacterium sp. C7(2022)]MDE0545559.1 methionyl-tRNA formyltransferase [Microbacterium sp. C7(2022)]
MRLVFAGTPHAAVPSLHALAARGHDIASVVTRRDAPLGRKRVLTPSPVASAAESLGLSIHRTDRLDAAASDEIMALEPELGVIVAYGGLVREPLLSAPTHGWINLHFSLLPRWRGAAPVQHALIAGDRVTGASVFALVAGLDAGDVYDEITVEVDGAATSGDLLTELADAGAQLLARVVDDIEQERAVGRPQQGEVTYASKLEDADGRLDWHQDATTVHNRFRGVTPEPGAHTTIEGARVKILEITRSEADTPALTPGAMELHHKKLLVGTGSDPLVLSRVQPAGKGAMNATDWFRGLRAVSPVLGS